MSALSIPVRQGPPSTTKHYLELDSLRGLGAFTVIFCHFMGAYPEDVPWFWLFTNTPLAVLRGGNEGIIFFFLLSGFVLSLSFLGKKNVPYLPFLTKRLFRLYPAYILSVFAAFALKRLLYDGPIPGYGWTNTQWIHPATWSIFAEHLPMITRFRTAYLNSPVWSLVVEMRISLVFPLLMVFYHKFRGRAVWGAALFSLLCGYADYYLRTTHGHKDLQSILRTLSFAGFFVMGAYLAHNRKQLIESLLSLGALKRRALVAAGLLLYTNDLWISCRWIAAVIPQTEALNQPPLTNLITSVGASIILIWAISAPSFLSNKAVHFFGKISYSTYLWHMVVLFTSIATLHALFPIWQVLLIAFGVTVIVSTLSFYYIEMPTMRLGHRLSKALALWMEQRRSTRMPCAEQAALKEP
jgi:peptidoglycan/LPS O-acetylase OafA/YrhL